MVKICCTGGYLSRQVVSRKVELQQTRTFSLVNTRDTFARTVFLEDVFWKKARLYAESQRSIFLSSTYIHSYSKITRFISRRPRNLRNIISGNHQIETTVPRRPDTDTCRKSLTELRRLRRWGGRSSWGG